MKNRDFFHLQYNKINWANQEKTHINQQINEYVIDEIISKHSNKSIAIFDIGFGIGFFIRMLYQKLRGKFESITLAGCEPSRINYPVSYTHLRAHETDSYLVCRLLLEK